MGKQGKRTPKLIRAFIIREKRNAQGLTQGQLAARVEANFGEAAKVDKSTVGRILRLETDRISYYRASDEQTGAFETGPELESHRLELYYFGQRYRDRRVLLVPHQALTHWLGGSKCVEWLFWSGQPAIPAREPAEMSEEEWNVEEGWRGGLFNARTHPLFPSFRDHLAGCTFWKDFDRLEAQVSDYLRSCKVGYDKVVEKVGTNFPGLPEVYVHSMAMSVVAGASQMALTESSASDFSYAIQEEMSGDDVWWTLQVGAWIIRSQHWGFLHQMVDVHKRLLRGASKWDEFLSVRRHQVACQDTILAIQQALAPAAKLRRRVMRGSCSICKNNF